MTNEYGILAGFLILAGIYLGGTAAFVAVIVLTARALGVPI